MQSAGVMHEGELATRLGLTGIPVAAETAIIDRDIRLVELTGARYHIHQISSGESVEAVRQAKARGLAVSCGVSTAHLMLNENDVENYRTFAKLNPPLRSEDDRLALVDGLADGTIDIVVSGHNPQDAEAKRQPFAQAAYGSVGVETLLSVLLSLHHAHGLDLATLIRTVTGIRPAFWTLTVAHCARAHVLILRWWIWKRRGLSMPTRSNQNQKMRPLKAGRYKERLKPVL